MNKSEKKYNGAIGIEWMTVFGDFVFRITRMVPKENIEACLEYCESKETADVFKERIIDFNVGDNQLCGNIDFSIILKAIRRFNHYYPEFLQSIRDVPKAGEL